MIVLPHSCNVLWIPCSTLAILESTMFWISTACVDARSNWSKDPHKVLAAHECKKKKKKK